ncbi:hypothetical protein NONI108955_08965 [Nocardia ninae]
MRGRRRRGVGVRDRRRIRVCLPGRCRVRLTGGRRVRGVVRRTGRRRLRALRAGRFGRRVVAAGVLGPRGRGVGSTARLDRVVLGTVPGVDLSGAGPLGGVHRRMRRRPELASRIRSGRRVRRVRVGQPPEVAEIVGTAREPTGIRRLPQRAERDLGAATTTGGRGEQRVTGQCPEEFERILSGVGQYRRYRRARIRHCDNQSRAEIGQTGRVLGRMGQVVDVGRIDLAHELHEPGETRE